MSDRHREIHAREIAEALVDDPLTQLVMRADRIARWEMLQLIETAVLASQPCLSAAPSATPDGER